MLTLEAPITWEQYLRDSALSREALDDFLQRPRWAQFDPELGYVLYNSLVPWGMDDSWTIETVGVHGARSRFLYAGRKPRINSYGDSFTECNQVSDGETWQEYLAGHFGEPIGNYGVGGHGVYQAYRRMLREEQTEHGAEHVILYVWGDDPTRSLMRARWAALYRGYELAGHNHGRWRGNPQAQIPFHGNPWPHVEMDVSSGRFVEKENPLPTPESLYEMCDPEWMADFLRDDLAVQLGAYASGQISDLAHASVDQLSRALDVRFEWGSDEDCRKQAAELLNVYSQRATNYILDKAKAFVQSSNKKLLVVLNFTDRPIKDYFRDPDVPSEGGRRDQEIVDHLAAGGFDYFDMNAVHQREYETTTGSFSQYMSQYIVGGAGHYSPRGNHFFAYSIKDKLLEMLDPQPVTYRGSTGSAIDFSAYL